MATMKIKKNDSVKVIAGKDKNKVGKVLKVVGNRLIVEGINMVSKHSKPSQQNPKGGIIQEPAPIDASNVMLMHKGKPTRVGFKFVETKKGLKKVRYAKTTGDVID
ncbi:MAG: 50S ribosomal protein L24 [Clostridiales bacterium]|nr:50S ribosomal protein L24 [Clostridiales bacterium]